MLFCVAAASCAGSLAFARDEQSDTREIPAAFAPFEYLIGAWKGQGMPKESGAQQFRGWTEKHAWAWVFTKGKPSGLSFTIEGGKVVASGKITFDPAKKRYHLEGKTPTAPGTPIAFEGKLDSTGKLLVLDRVASKKGPAADSGEMRITLRPNANFIRYTMTQDKKPAGSAVFSRTLEVGVTKEGETFAAGAATTERPKCIVTGGQATMSVTFEGKTFPLCCTGCLGEFNDNPQKYVKKAALLLGSSGKPKAAAAAKMVRRRDDAFAADVDTPFEPPPQPQAKAKKNDSSAGGTQAKADDADDTEPTAPAKPKGQPPVKKDAGKKTASKAASHAATLVRLGRALERNGKTAQALSNYRQVVQDYPDTPSAKTAAERIKQLEK